ncbi:MAG TPA: DUF2171 domain-containing protein [Methylophilaceae bacterium]|nr:DUF2171 domain-containing protein [Methylophilaceae bacterium]
MINAEEIKNDMVVLSNQAEQFAVVDHLDGRDTIKLKKDSQGNHHYIPLSWIISSGDGQLKVNKTVEQAMQDWSNSPLKSTSTN